MKIKITSEKFNSINDIECKDGYDATWSDWQSYKASELSDYTDYTTEQLEQAPALCDVLSRAMNRASEQAVASAYYSEQDSAYESFINRLESQLNDSVRNSCEHGNIEGKISLSVVSHPDCLGGGGEILIEGDAKTLALMTMEIINGEGMFRYDTLSEFATVMDGKYAPARAVKHHLHYLLNSKLIADIWGDRYSTVSELIDDRAIGSAYPDDAMIKEAIDYEMDEAGDDVRDEILAIKYASEFVIA